MCKQPNKVTLTTTSYLSVLDEIHKLKKQKLKWLWFPLYIRIPYQLPSLPSTSYAPKIITYISLTKEWCLVLHPTKVPFSLIPRATKTTEEDTHFLHNHGQGAVTFYLPLTACLYPNFSIFCYPLLHTTCKSRLIIPFSVPFNPVHPTFLILPVIFIFL